MNKRRTLIILAICLAAVVAAVVSFIHPREPRYRDRPLSDYVTVFGRVSAADSWEHEHLSLEPERQEAIAALHSIGTNALPFLLKWIQWDPQTPLWRTNLANQLRPSNPSDNLDAVLVRLEHSKRERLAAGTEIAFQVLGTQAVSAIPRLTRLMDGPAPPYAADTATMALGAIGTNSLPTLLAVIHNPKHPRRLMAFSAIAFMRNRCGPSVDAAVPHLVECLSDTNDPQVPLWAAGALGQFDSASPLTLTALTNCLTSSNTNLRFRSADALGRIGGPAVPALPALTNALSDPDATVSSAASNAIFQITSEALTNASPR